MFTRRDVCLLADMDVERFKYNARKDLLPTYASHDALIGVLEDKNASSWTRYTAEEALMTAVMERLACQIGYCAGLPYEAASSIVNNNGGLIVAEFRKPSRLDVWIGYVGHPRKLGSHDGGFNVGGALAAVIKSVQSVGAFANAKERLFLVNISEVVRAVSKRARDNKLDLA